MQSNSKAWLLWFLWMGEGATGLRRNSGPLLPDQHLRDFSALVYRFGGRWRQCRASASMTGCQDQFNSHNGRKGHLTSVIFSNMLQSCCWLAPLRRFAREWCCAVWMLSSCESCWISWAPLKHSFGFPVVVFLTKLLFQTAEGSSAFWAEAAHKTNGHFLLLLIINPTFVC